MNLIDRKTDRALLTRFMSIFPVTVILGPRQCGKTTLARTLIADSYFDLENPRDVARLEQPQLALEDLTGLIVIDEIQRSPDLFPLLRYLVDQGGKRKFVILGSASRDLIRQTSESLAGRIAYFQLGGFRLSDIDPGSIKDLWWRGGLPRSFLAASDDESLLWRNQYVMTFLERDIPQLGITIPARTLRRFWTMLSHYHGQILNYAELGRSFGVSDMTVRKYCDILEGTFMVRILQPWFINIGKRLVKRPKLYLRDSGLLHLDGHHTDAAIHAAKIARDSGTAVMLDAGTMVPRIDELLVLADIVIASKKFAERFTGKEKVETALKIMFTRNTKFAVVTLGPHGSMGFDGKTFYHQPSFPVEVIDTTGAGDVFHGAFAYRYVNGGDWQACLRFATAVAALKCTKLGGRTGIPTLAETEHFLQEHE